MLAANPSRDPHSILANRVIWVTRPAYQDSPWNLDKNPSAMQNFKLHPAGLLFLALILSLVAGCREDDSGGNLPPDRTQQPAVVAAPPIGTPRPTETPGQAPSPERPTKRAAQTGVIEAPSTRPAQATPTPRPASTPTATATSGPAHTPVPISGLPVPALLPASDGIYDYAAVTTGKAHTCLLRNDGAVLCTGTVDNETPFPAPAVALDSVTSGPNHACGIESDGSVACWGDDEFGQADPPEGVFISVSAGGAHTCGIKPDGAVACWGNDEFGQADPPEGTFTSVSAGAVHTCSTESDGAVACWGNDEFGQASPLTGNFLSVSSGTFYSCGLRADGEVICWGVIQAGEDGQCFRICSYAELVSDEEAESATVSFQQVHVGFAGSCGVTTGNSLRCWGLVSGRANSPPEGEYAEVSVGVHHVCGLRTDGAVVCWAVEPGEEVPGADSLLVCLADADGATTCPGEPEFEMEAMAQSGWMIRWEVYSHDGTDYNCGYRLDNTLVCWNADRTVFLDPALTSVRAFAATNDDTACWLLPDHMVACWGSISAPEGAFRSISLDKTVYSVFACGIQTGGSLSCWGDHFDDWGHLNPPAGEYKAVSTGFGHGCAIRMDDTLVCWGNHNIGTPPEGPFRSIDGSGLLHCGIRTDHTVECWGSGTRPNLSGAYQSVRVGAFSLTYVCGVRLDETLRCQGNHQTGEISPPIGRFQSVSAGSTHACGVRVDGTAACWGTHDEAHDGDTGQLTPPVGEFRSVSVGGSWSASSEFSCGIRTDGSLTCWGRPNSAVLKNLLDQ